MKDYGKTIKCKIKNILNDCTNYDLFFTCVKKSNDIYFICSNFINCYVLYCFKENKQIPILNCEFIRMAFKSLSKKSKGPKPKGSQLETLIKLNNFFEKEFVYLITNDKIINNIEDCKFDSINLSYIFNLFATEMATSYTNHIILNFFKYVNQYVNQNFIKKDIKRLTKDEYKDLSKNEQDKYNLKISEQHKKNKIIKEEINLVKSDLIDEPITLKSDKKYHEWINLNKKIIFPKKEINMESYVDDIKINYHKYRKHMLLMNEQLEQNKMKLFSSISLRTEIHDKYVHIDTSVLKDIFSEVNGGKTNEELWKEYFNIDPKKFKLKEYSFNFQISTNGFSVSINFIKNDKIEGKNKKSKAKACATKRTKDLRKTKTEKEIIKIKEDQKKKKMKESIEVKNKKKEENKKLKIEFKSKSKEEQDKIILKMKFNKNKYEYIEDAVKNTQVREKFNEWLNLNLIKVIDPGNNSPMTILGERTKDKKLLEKTRIEIEHSIPQTGKERSGKVLFSYSSKRRIKETKRKKYCKLRENKKRKVKLNDKSIEELEGKLSLYNSKTTNYDKFKKYVQLKLAMRKSVSKYEYEKKKNELNDVNDKIKTKEINLIKEIEFNKFIELNIKVNNLGEGIKYNEYIQKLKWFGYINKSAHEDKLLNEIERIYGSDAVFVIGNWSNKGNLKKISMPNIGMIKLLSKRFKVFLIDEFRTSILNYKTEEKMKNLKVKSKEIHSIFTLKMGKNSGCINRDYNACMNMHKIVKNLIKTKERPYNFCHSTKSDLIRKLSNPKGIQLNSALFCNKHKCVHIGERLIDFKLI